MAQNYLFKPYKLDDYIRIAEEAADWIKSTEKLTEAGKIWEQSPDSEEDFSDYPMLTEKALYGGSAGIGLFYLRLYQATKNEEYLEEAIKAADHIITTDEGIDFYKRTLSDNAVVDKLVHVKNMPGWKIGYYNGPTGQAYLHLKLYEITKDVKYKNYAIKVADDLLSTAIETDDGIHWSEQGDLCGDGGFITYLIFIWELTKDVKYFHAAK